MIIADFDKELDCSGMLCPIPVIKTAEAIREIEIGEVLRMISTDRGSPPDMEAWSRQTGHELMGYAEEDGSYIFHFRRKQ